jgi:hypothetical protein
MEVSGGGTISASVGFGWVQGKGQTDLQGLKNRSILYEKARDRFSMIP